MHEPINGMFMHVNAFFVPKLARIKAGLTETSEIKGGIVMNFTSFQEGDKLTIALTGEIDHHCAKTYIRIIAAKIETYMPET